MKRFLVVALCLAMLSATGLAFVGCTSNEPAADDGGGDQPLKVAMLMSGPANDAGWNQLAYEGLMALKNDRGYDTAVSENVAQADQLGLLRNYANQGYDYIIAHGFEYEDALNTVAAEFPDTTFIQIGGVGANGANLNSVLFTEAEAGYYVGTLAGLMTQTNKVGWIGGMDIPSMHADYDGYVKGVHDVNPDAQVVCTWADSWTDITKGKDSAEAQMSEGVDIICANADAVNLGVAQAVKGTDVYMMGWSLDQSSEAPDNVLTCNIQDVGNMLMDLIDKGLAGELTGSNYVMGLKEGAQYLSSFNPVVPQDVQDRVNQVIQDIKDGKITDFGMTQESSTN